MFIESFIKCLLISFYHAADSATLLCSIAPFLS